MFHGMSVAVVVLNYNGLAHLQCFLPILLQYTAGEAEIIVADNASTDNSVLFLTEQFPSVKQIFLETNTGYAGGYNAALRQVEADVYILLNSDVEVTSGWISPVLNWLEKDSSHAAAMPKIRSQASRMHFEYAGACGGYLDGLGIPFCRGRVMDTVEEDKGQYNDSQPVFWASGAALFIRSAAFWECGGFDDSFFAHMEEIDLCWRLQLKGYIVGVVPEAMVYHVGGGTLPVGERKLMLNLRNSLLMINRNTAGPEKWTLLLLRCLLDWTFALKELLYGRTTALQALLPAHKSFWKYRRSSENKFGPLRRKPLYSLCGVSRRWIPVDYLLRGRKTFSEIMHLKTRK